MRRAVECPPRTGDDGDEDPGMGRGRPAALHTGRVIGRYGSGPGPKLISIGGLHGNEPSGVLALQRVLASLQDIAPPFRGEMVALAGNIRALRAGRRFLVRDLNRSWTPRRMARARAAPGQAAEDVEQAELMRALDRELDRDSAWIRVIDLTVQVFHLLGFRKTRVRRR